jgi:PTH1 family peptidyl-tRNA hydrolase
MGALTKLFGRFRARAAEKLGERDGDEAKETWLVAGLGNPGERYRRTRHNLGFMVIDHLAHKLNAGPAVAKFEARVAQAQLNARARLLLVQPQTFYNQSGRSVAAVARYFRVPQQRLIVVHDDLDLEAGRLKIIARGSDAGNRGVRSLHAAFGSTEIARVRLGIGRPKPNRDPVEFVLYQMSEAELAAMREVIERAAQAVEAIIRDGVAAAMNLYNQRG